MCQSTILLLHCYIAIKLLINVIVNFFCLTSINVLRFHRVIFSRYVIVQFMDYCVYSEGTFHSILERSAFFCCYLFNARRYCDSVAALFTNCSLFSQFIHCLFDSFFRPIYYNHPPPILSIATTYFCGYNWPCPFQGWTIIKIWGWYPQEVQLHNFY